LIFLKIHKSENGDMVAMCDESLISSVISEGAIEINIRDYSDFYKGDLVSKEDAAGMVDPKTIYTANIVGEEAVSAAIEANVIDSGSVKRAGSVPYAQAFRVRK
jgi:hypothetical protein